MTLAALQDHAQKADSLLSDAQHGPELYYTVGKMLDFCTQRPLTQPFTARGIVIDTTRDITQQISDYFPAHIDLSPVIDRLATVCVERAQATGQHMQVLHFEHLKHVKAIPDADANINTFIEVFPDRRMKLSKFQGFKTDLKAIGGGSAGNANDMIQQLKEADIQGFALRVKSLDVKDEQAKEILVKMGIAQAMGGNGDAVAAAIETIAKGGDAAKQLQTAIENIVEIKTLRQALINAGDGAAAAPIAAALALKTEILSANLVTLNAPPAVRAEIIRTIEGIKIDLTARQIEGVISALSKALPVSLIGRAANDVGARNSLNVQVSRAVEAVRVVAQTNNMPIRDAIALTLTNHATPELAAPIKQLTTLISKPDFLPTIERTLPPVVSSVVHNTLTTPPLQAAMQPPAPILHAPSPIASVAQAMHSLGEQSAQPTIKMAAVMLEVTAQAPLASINAAPLQSVAENLRALPITNNFPPALQMPLAVVTAQVEALAVQARMPAPLFENGPQPLAPQAPLAQLAKVLDIKAPDIVPPAPQIHPQPSQTILKSDGPVQPLGGSAVQLASPLPTGPELKTPTPPEINLTLKPQAPENKGPDLGSPKPGPYQPNFEPHNLGSGPREIRLSSQQQARVIDNIHTPAKTSDPIGANWSPTANAPRTQTVIIDPTTKLPTVIGGPKGGGSPDPLKGGCGGLSCGACGKCFRDVSSTGISQKTTAKYDVPPPKTVLKIA